MFLLLVLAVGVLIGLAALLCVNVEGDTEPTPKPTLDPEREW